MIKHLCIFCGHENDNDVTYYNGPTYTGEICRHWYCRKCKKSWFVTDPEPKDEATSFNFGEIR